MFETQNDPRWAEYIQRIGMGRVPCTGDDITLEEQEQRADAALRHIADQDAKNQAYKNTLPGQERRGTTDRG